MDDDLGPVAPPLRNPTMNDVARAAGVALRTVSRFVNGQTNIDPVLAERIRAAILDLGYRRNIAAASIRPGWTSKMLGLIIGDLANPYYSALARAIEVRARDNGYMLTTVSSDENGARHDQLIDRLMEQRTDGLIVVPPRETGRDWSTVARPIPPLVFVDRPIEFDHADTIVADNAGGAALAVDVLLQNGATRVAFLGDSLDIYTMRERYAGFIRAHEARGMETDEARVRPEAHSDEQAAVIVRELLEDGQVDAIFAANNRASVGALMAFRDLGRRVPLIGFDDFEAGLLSSPSTSVVTHDIAEMGRQAAAMVLKRIAGDTSPRRTLIMPVALILRGSEK